jgi:hypothetical protein
MKMTIRQIGENKYKKGWKLDRAEKIGIVLAVAIAIFLRLLFRG